MRIQAILLAAASLMTTGCTSMFSLLPAVTEKQAISNSALAGVWGDNESSDILTITSEADNTYRVTLQSGKDAPLRFQGRLFRAGDAEVLDLVAKTDAVFTLPAHFFVRVWATGNTFRWAYLDSDWLKKQAASMASQTVDDALVLTGSSDAVAAFLRANGGDTRAYKDIQEMQRLK